jgi:hypothetical protein
MMLGGDPRFKISFSTMNDVTPKTFPDIPDTDIEMNDPWNRGISARLYIGDAEQRLRQAKEKHNGQ